MRNGSICGAEALIRWQHKELGFISPEKFIAIAEDCGLIYDLGLWVISTAFGQQKKWNDAGFNHVRIAINISAKQLENNQFVRDIEARCKEFELTPSMIELEVTESTAMQDPTSAIEKLNELRALGFELAIDDFGTGYSSLAYLTMLPIQTLKVDKAFVNDLENDVNNAAICKATISLSHDLGLQVVAEGVETDAQRQYLKENKCDILQGYFFSRPLPALKVTEFIQQFVPAG